MLFKTISEIKQYVPANISNNFKTLEPAIRLAEKEHIIPAIGQAQYDALHTAYHGEEPLEGALSALLPEVQLPLAHLLYYTGLATLNVSLTDSGLQITEGDGFKPANPWQVDDLRRHFCENGYKALDYLLSFLEQYVEDYPLWKDSEAFTLHRSNFINTASDFNNYLQINRSRYTFQALRPLMNRVEDIHLHTILGDLYTEIKNRIRSGELAAGDAEVISLAQPAVAYLTAAAAIAELSIEITAAGFLVSPYKSVVNAVNKHMEINLAALRRNRYEELGNLYLKDLRDYLNANASADMYSTYFFSPAYQAPGTVDRDVFVPQEGGCYGAF